MAPGAIVFCQSSPVKAAAICGGAPSATGVASWGRVAHDASTAGASAIRRSSLIAVGHDVVADRVRNAPRAMDNGREPGLWACGGAGGKAAEHRCNVLRALRQAKHQSTHGRHDRQPHAAAGLGATRPLLQPSSGQPARPISMKRSGNAGEVMGANVVKRSRRSMPLSCANVLFSAVRRRSWSSPV